MRIIMREIIGYINTGIIFIKLLLHFVIEIEKMYSIHSNSMNSFNQKVYRC